MKVERQFVVKAEWDDEAGVWVAQSDDVPGLATEAPTQEALLAKLKVMLPELIEANGVPDGDDIPFELVSTLTAIAHRQHA
jgi:predicted RNase H-like HicB family nuclease